MNHKVFHQYHRSLSLCSLNTVSTARQDLQNKPTVCILSCIKRGAASSQRAVIIPLYSALMRLHLKYHIQAQGPQNKKDMELLAQV